MIFYAITANAAKASMRAYSEEAIDLVLAGRIEEAFALPSILLDEDGEPDLSEPETRLAVGQPGFAVVATASTSKRGEALSVAEEYWRRHEAQHGRPGKMRRAVP